MTRTVELIALTVLAVILALGGSGGVGAAERQHGAQPRDRAAMNVVLFVIDDTRFDSLGAAGNPVIHTPRLDTLARDGVLFRQAFVTTSVCWASRASILTGQYMSRHGVTSPGVSGGTGRAQDTAVVTGSAGERVRVPVVPIRSAIAPEAWADSLPGVLQRAGYWTGFTGKWHLGGLPEAYWDYSEGFQGHWHTLPGGERIHDTERNLRNALRFLRDRPRDRPFLLDVSFFAAHAVDDSAEQYFPQQWSGRHYATVTIPPPLHPLRSFMALLPPFLSAEENEGRIRYHWRFDGTEARYQEYMKRYYRLVTEVDDAVGRVVDELSAQGIYDNTLIVFIGDNGYFQSDRGLGDKWYPYEESIRVPLIVYDPRLVASRRGQARTEMALNIDVAPTIMQAAGQPVPAGVQGKDLARLYLDETAADWRDEFFYEMHQIGSRARIPASQAVVRRDWKYTYWPDWDYEQLFHLTTDPAEARDVARDPAHAQMLATMRQKLDDWRRRAR